MENLIESSDEMANFEEDEDSNSEGESDNI